MWIWLIAKILINIINTLGFILNIPDTFLALTLLSIGNSAGGNWKNNIFLLNDLYQINYNIDLSLNCALAQTGYGEMGLAGSIAGPLFNMMIGFGFSCLKKIYKNNG